MLPLILGGGFSGFWTYPQIGCAWRQYYLTRSDNMVRDPVLQFKREIYGDHSVHAEQSRRVPGSPCEFLQMLPSADDLRTIPLPNVLLSTGVSSWLPSCRKVSALPKGVCHVRSSSQTARR